jgi:hypothetical protein
MTTFSEVPDLAVARPGLRQAAEPSAQRVEVVTPTPSTNTRAPRRHDTLSAAVYLRRGAIS